MNYRTIAATVAVLVLPLTAACGASDDPNDNIPAGKKAGETLDCKHDKLSKADREALCPSKEDAAKAAPPKTELKVGQPFTYKDGVKVTVVGLVKLTQFGEYEDPPKASETAFRAVWKITNGSQKPIDLDDWSDNEQGATRGGEATMIMVEKGAKQMTGRLAPGQTGTYTDELSLPKSDGNSVVVTISRMDDAAGFLDEDPHWTGTIQ